MFQRLLFSIGLAAVVTAPALYADSIAWEVNGSEQFGTIDLNTGGFTLLASQAAQLAGLGVLNGTLYGGGSGGDTLYSVNTTTGALTSVGTGSITYADFGSTLTGLYAIGSNGYLYTVNPNGSTTLDGPTGLSITSITIGLSTNSSTLYYSVGGTLYTLNTNTGAATAVGAMGTSGDGAMVLEGGSLWAGVNSPLSVDTLNTSSGAASVGSSVSGTTALFWGLAPDPIPASASPEPGTWSLLAASIGVLAYFRRRLTRESSRRERCAPV